LTLGNARHGAADAHDESSYLVLRPDDESADKRGLTTTMTKTTAKITATETLAK